MTSASIQKTAARLAYAQDSTRDGVLNDLLNDAYGPMPTARPTRVGIVGCCVRVHFPYEQSLSQYNRAFDQAKNLLADGPFEVVRVGDPYESPEAMLQALDGMVAEGLDALILHHSTYTAGEIGIHLGRWLMDCKVPILSWSFPDKQGGRLEANSLCCQNFILNMWNRLGVKYAWMYGDAGVDVPSQLTRFARSVRARQQMLHGKLLHVGGSRVTAFYDGETDELAVMRRLGLRFDRIDLVAMQDRVDAISQFKVKPLREALKQHELCGKVDIHDAQIDQTLRLGLAILEMAREERYLGCTIKSWPELFDSFGCAIDGAVAMLNDYGLCTAEEGEMNGLISSLAMNLLSNGSASSTMMDVSAVSQKKNRIGLWHCGASPTKLLRPGTKYELRKHSILENADPDGAVGLMVEMLLRTGPVTVVRYQSPDASRMLAFEGEIVDSPMAFRGTYGEMEPSDATAADIIGSIMSGGLDHHWSLGYGRWRESLRMLNHWLGVDEIEIGHHRALYGLSQQVPVR